tara:strand:+ start:709 stop:1818 length:1110 start_codon:yes stop_codon:yes gene_type:complete
MKILFWTGYNDEVFKTMENVDSNFDSDRGWGSEGSLCRLAVGLNKLGHEVDIFGGLGMKSQGVNIMDYDAVIVQRYLNFLIYEDTNHPNIILWLHDTIALPWYKGVAIEDSGKNLYELAARNNIFRKSVVLTPFHERKIRSVYELPQGHFEVIGHGINQEIDTNDLTKKIPYRMIWTSDWLRGLKKTIQIMNHISPKEVAISLEIFGEGSSPSRNLEYYDKENPTLRQVIEQSPHEIIIRPRVDNDELVASWGKTDFWFYPTDFEETYCITALEAQRAGAFCFTSNVGSLPDVIGDRGLIYHEGKNTEEYYMHLAKVLKYYLLNPEEISDIKSRGVEWAKTQTSINMAKQWESLLLSGVNNFKFFEGRA